MTMVESTEENYKELHCGFCDKFMGYIKIGAVIMKHDFLCSLKCQLDYDNEKKSKMTDLLFGRPENKEMSL